MADEAPAATLSSPPLASPRRAPAWWLPHAPLAERRLPPRDTLVSPCPPVIIRATIVNASRPGGAPTAPHLLAFLA